MTTTQPAAKATGFVPGSVRVQEEPIDKMILEEALKRSMNTPYIPKFDSNNLPLPAPERVASYRFNKKIDSVYITTISGAAFEMPTHVGVEHAKRILNEQYMLGIEFDESEDDMPPERDYENLIDLATLHHMKARKIARDNGIAIPEGATPDEVKAILQKNKALLEENEVFLV